MADPGDCKRLGNRALNTIKIFVPIAGQMSRDNLLETLNPALTHQWYTLSQKIWSVRTGKDVPQERANSAESGRLVVLKRLTYRRVSDAKYLETSVL